MNEYEAMNQYETFPDTDTDTARDGDRSGRHPLNITHLVMGIAFLGFVGIWAVIASDTVAASDVRWLLPVPWVLAGAGGLLAIALASRRGAQDR